MPYKLVLFFLLLVGTLNAQPNYQRALTLWDNEQYSSAAKYFTLSLHEPITELQRQYAQIRIAHCAYHQLRDDAETLLMNALQEYPKHPLSLETQIYYANLLFLKKDYDAVEPLIQDKDPTSLPSELQQETAFMKAYLAFKKKKYTEALQNFQLITPEFYRFEEARYYQAVSLFSTQQYEKALNLFQELEKTEAYALKVPMYIVQCLYHLGSPELLNQAKKYISQAPAPEQQAEMAIFVGKAYYERQDYENALPFLEKAQAMQPKDRSLAFITAKAAQATLQHEKAITYFEKTFSINDTLSAYAAYLAAFSAIQMDNTEKAKNLFLHASKYASNDLKPEATFQYAKTASQLREHSEALNALSFYLQQYPNHKHFAEAKGLFGENLLYSGKLAEAIQFFEQSPTQDPRIQKSFQQNCFYFAIQLAEKQQTDSAILFLRKAININKDEQITLSAKFWLAELLYQKADFTQAEQAYQDYLESYNVTKHSEYARGWAGYGWAVFQQRDYPKAIQAFEKALQKLNPKQYPNEFTDVCLRLGDCHFVTKNYEKADEYYAKVVNNPKLPSQDYAYFQKALCQARLAKGANMNAQYRQAVQLFDHLIKTFPNSPHRPAALNQAAEILIIWLADYDKGAKYAQQLLEEYQNHVLTANAHLHLGIAAYNTQQNEKAKKHFMTVVMEYGNYEVQVATALDALTSLLEPNELQQLQQQYQQKYPHAVKAFEPIAFNQARDLYYAEDYEQAIAKLSNYLETYPHGKNRFEALLMRGDAYEKRKQDSLALIDYHEVLQAQLNPFTSQALKNAASLHLRKKQYAQAETLWKQLDSLAANYQDKITAQFGLAETYSLQNQHEKAQNIYQTLIQDAQTSEYTRTRASLMLAKTFISQKQYDKALPLLQKIADETTHALGAEAQALLAQIAFLKQDYEDCKKHAFVFRQKFTGYNDWKAHAYFYLAQAYWQQKEHYQAIETLKSLLSVENTTLRKDIEQLLKQYEKEYQNLASQTSVPQDTTPQPEPKQQKPKVQEVPRKKTTSPQNKNNSTKSQPKK